MAVRAYGTCRPFRLIVAPATDAGWNFAARLAKTEGFPLYSVVLTASEVGPEDRKRAEEAGLGGVVPLAAEGAELAEVVCSIVLGHRYSEGVNPALCLMGKARKRNRQESDGLSILVVDDSANTRMLVKYYLADTPYHLVFAENGSAGVEAYTQDHYDMVIMGTHLTGMNGFSAARAIRNWEKESRTDPVPLLAITAHYIPDDGAQSLEAGFTDFIDRPFTKPKLLNLVEQYIR